MLMFVLPRPLFTFQDQSPALEPLFQLPPTKTPEEQHRKTLIQSLFYCFKTLKSFFWGIPPHPLIRAFRKPRANVEVRMTKTIVHNPIPKPSIRTIVPKTTNKDSSVCICNIVLIKKI
jgi:hypothetical protein